MATTPLFTRGSASAPVTFPQSGFSQKVRLPGLLGLTRNAVAFCLVGYALAGRGFAYMSVPPLYPGEVLLALLALQFVCTPRAWNIFRPLPQPWMILLLLAWGVVCVVPYIGVYGMDALRDSALTYYSLYAVVIGGLLTATGRPVAILIQGYNKFISIFLPVAPFVLVIYNLFPVGLPTVPGTNIPFPSHKPGDMMVHVTGIMVFFLSGCGVTTPARWILLIMLAFGNSYSRGGLVSAIAACSLCLALRPSLRSSVAAALLVGSILLVGSFVNVETATGRRLSSGDLLSSLESVGGSDDLGFEGSRQWRQLWWNDIIDYTLEGDYFWTGKGFGINLADDDGFQVGEATGSNDSLRSPHNSHLAVLARTGVPGFIIWAAVILSMLGSLLRIYIASATPGLERWRSVSLFLLCYLVAFIVNATFDVYLEGPMGGVWFWTIYGCGIALVYSFKREVTGRSERLSYL